MRYFKLLLYISLIFSPLAQAEIQDALANRDSQVESNIPLATIHFEKLRTQYFSREQFKIQIKETISTPPRQQNADLWVFIKPQDAIESSQVFYFIQTTDDPQSSSIRLKPQAFKRNIPPLQQDEQIHNVFSMTVTAELKGYFDVYAFYMPVGTQPNINYLLNEQICRQTPALSDLLNEQACRQNPTLSNLLKARVAFNIDNPCGTDNINIDACIATIEGNILTIPNVEVGNSLYPYIALDILADIPFGKQMISSGSITDYDLPINSNPPCANVVILNPLRLNFVAFNQDDQQYYCATLTPSDNPPPNFTIIFTSAGS